MKFLLATPGRFHTMALARELQSRNLLIKVISGLPQFALKREKIQPERLQTVPFFQTLQFGFRRMHFLAPCKELSYRATVSVDDAAARFLNTTRDLPDIYMALSQTGKRSGNLAKNLGITYVCDRGSTHILEQQAILIEEHRIQSAAPPVIDQRSIERELAEYDQADLITVPSRFVRDTFLKQGVTSSKLLVVPYGANLSMFRPTLPKTESAFNVLFVGALSLRKGLPYLLDAFNKVQHGNKHLTLIGSPLKETEEILKKHSKGNVRVLGPVAQLQLAAHMSAANVFVLASVEEGLALVMAEAMACGCPVVATTNTGADDLFTDGVEGFVVPPRSSSALLNRMQLLADNPSLAKTMSTAARTKIETIGGWAAYTENLIDQFDRRLHLNLSTPRPMPNGG